MFSRGREDALRLRSLMIARWMTALFCSILASASGFSAAGLSVGDNFDVAQLSAKPRIDQLIPSSGTLGEHVTVRGSNFTAKGNVVHFQGAQRGFLADSPVQSSTGEDLQFQVTTCRSEAPQCPGYNPLPGDYSVTITNENGMSNPAKFVLLSRPPRLE
jgi:hypothetical protein